jgi:hypothetical protein
MRVQFISLFRAILLASATATTFAGRLSIIRVSQGRFVPSQAISSSGDNNSCAGKFVERRVDSDHNRLVPDQQTPRCLMLPNVPAIWVLCKALQHKRQLRK